MSSPPGNNAFNPTKDLLIAAFIAFTFSLLYKVTYNLYFHPLSSFPGPFLGRVSRLYLLWTYTYGQEHLVDEQLHRKYGPIVRKAPNILVFNDTRMLPLVYNRRADKSDHYAFSKAFGIFGIQKHSEHAVARKRVAAPFTGSAVKRMQPLIQRRVDEWISTMDNEFAATGRPLDFAIWAPLLTYDVVWELCVGEPMGYVRNMKDVYGLWSRLNFKMFLHGFLSRIPGLARVMMRTGLIRYLNPLRSERVGLGLVMRLRDQEIERRQNNLEAEDRHDILSHLLAATQHPKGTLSIPQLKENLLLIMVAGTDPSAVALQSLILFLLTTPGKYAAFVASDLAAATNPPAFPYLDACIKETLRYMPPASDSFPRLSPAGGVTTPSGTFIPPGTELYANPYSTNRERTVFGEDAEQWRPERWLDGRAAEMERCMFTFGFGARVCLGKLIAEAELRIAARDLLTAFEPRLVNPERPYAKVGNYGILHYEGLWIALKRR